VTIQLINERIIQYGLKKFCSREMNQKAQIFLKNKVVSRNVLMQVESILINKQTLPIKYEI